ncbi:hypothetical protein LTR62_003622 [Meristemomyces frigidus]|uniref:Amidase domain-containing protein n=1 Tax=Meristemomyces frigidus TaxID=1508187 RepID=A0AAN7YKE8_9PEZI|nr:hypothetical protein LTR62_003622 [Meristemomyces frigidus]
MATDTEVPNWQTRTKQYREEAAAKIPKEWRLDSRFTTDLGPTSERNVLDIPAQCGLLTAEELHITEDFDAVALLDKLARGELTSLAVTIAFSKRAAIAQQLTCCLTETFFGQGLERAKYCDAYRAEHKKPIGPLHGLPISIKDSFDVKGIASTIGFVSFLDHGPKNEESTLVTILLDLGAVLYVKTNVPQSLMTGDSENNVFLRVLNPNKLCLGAGGSSGGEGALVRMKGSPLGVGTDIAGSIRIPAYVNGTFGLRPTCHRVPDGGQTGPGRPGNFGISAVAGPLTRSLRDIEAFMSAVLNYDCWSLDSGIIAAPWRPSPPAAKTNNSNLTIGYLTEDARLPLHPTVLRTLKTATTTLSKAGHSVIDLTPQLPPNTINKALLSAFTNFAMDPTNAVSKQVTDSGEPFIASVASASLPELKEFSPDLEDAWRLSVEREEYKALFQQLFVKNKLDVLMLPVHATTAVEHDFYGLPMYTVLGNLVDHPAITLPYLKADKGLDAEYIRDIKYTPEYKPDRIEGAPCGIQLLGRPMKDEELVRHAQMVADGLGIKSF